MFISPMFSIAVEPFVCLYPTIVVLNRTMLLESSVLPFVDVFYVDRGNRCLDGFHHCGGLMN